MAGADCNNDTGVESSTRRLLLVLCAAGVLFADIVVVEAASYFQNRAHPFESLHWNWLGKIASIIFSGLLLTWSPWLRRVVGLRWQQSTGSLKLSIGCFVMFFACAFGIGFAMPPTAYSLETLLFQFFMPAVDEELIFRGIILALLERAFGQSPMSCRLRFGYASLIVCVAFAIPHAIGIVDGGWQFSFTLFATTGVWAAIPTLVRTRSGSLLWPIASHGVWNGTIFLVAMLR